ncbi:MAG TPA: ABC transporter permease [Spirochaetia bacterium]|nr:ABC transporter permease [Spirochaetia bacterium]
MTAARNGAQQESKKRSIHPRQIPPVYITVALLFVVGLVFYLGNPNFITPYNLNTIISFSAILLMVALGQMCTILVGGIDLSVGGLVSFISVAFIVLIKPIGYLAYPACIIAGVLAGYINGFILTRVKIPSFIATLGTGGILTSLAYLVSPRPVNLAPDLYGVVDIVNGSLLKASNVLLIGLVVLAFFLVILRFTATGRNIFYIGSNIRMSWMSGINIVKTRTIAFMLSGLGAALVGITISSVRFGGDPVVGTSYVLNSIAAVVVGGTALTGGTGGVINTVFGSLFMSMMDNGMTVVGLDQYLQQAILGVMVIIGVTLTFDREKTPIVK